MLKTDKIMEGYVVCLFAYLLVRWFARSFVFGRLRGDGRLGRTASEG